MNRRGSDSSGDHSVNEADQRVLIVGAGEAGRMVLREINHHDRLRRSVVGFADDDPDKQGIFVSDQAPVLGTTDEVASICRDHDVDEVIIAMPSAPGEVVRTVTRQADRFNAELRIVPGIREIIEGDVDWNQIRTVQPEDLLGRDTVEVDSSKLEAFLEDKRVLVTGAAGSIGSHLVMEVLKYPVEDVFGLDINESDLYELEASRIPEKHRDHFYSILGDIRDERRIKEVFSDVKPDLVLHAAALKHVPMSERHPREVIRTNLAGTQTVLDAVQGSGVADCLVISTDKAVSGENIMGLSKRINELMVAKYQSEDDGTRYCAVRFGNVLGSRGSVVPLFKEQIRRGGPVTVTDPDVERYFMTPAEAVKLVLTAARFEHQGALYVLDLGDSIRILDLARQLISLSGYEPETEIPITFTGLRAGETMEESLLADDEQPRDTDHGKIRRLTAPVPENEGWSAFLRLVEDPPADVDSVMNSMRDVARRTASRD